MLIMTSTKTLNLCKFNSNGDKKMLFFLTMRKVVIILTKDIWHENDCLYENYTMNGLIYELYDYYSVYKPTKDIG